MTPRIYTAHALDIHTTVELSKSQAHYLKHVMRLKSDDCVRLFNGIDGEWMAQLHFEGKHSVTARCEEQTAPQVTLPPLILIACLIKPAKLELLIEKATELGVTRIQLASSDHTTFKKINDQRLLAHAIEAAEQSERLCVPEITPVQTLREACADTPILWAAERTEQTKTLDQNLTKESQTLLIGPEGGFSEKEKDYLLAAPHMTPVSLGPLILRAETAGIAMIAAYKNASGAWR